MAFDPIQEDCLRLILAGMKREHVYPMSDAIYIARGMEAYQADADSLITTDAERSFHLMARAAELADYRLPFTADEQKANGYADQATALLDEAIALDAGNWDAQRMRAAMEAETNSAYLDYLIEHRDEVQRDLAQRIAGATDAYDREFTVDLGRRPYLRWLACTASQAVITGRYRMALDVAEESLAFEPTDPGDIRHTAMLAMAKLEMTHADLVRFQKRHNVAYMQPTATGRRQPAAAKRRDAWALLAEISIAYRALDYDGAARYLRQLLRSYTHAAAACWFQAEFPDGLFARVNLIPGSEDELVIALSEATPLLQEGYGAPDNASFSTWLSEHELVQADLDQQVASVQGKMAARRPGSEN